MIAKAYDATGYIKNKNDQSKKIGKDAIRLQKHAQYASAHTILPNSYAVLPSTSPTSRAKTRPIQTKPSNACRARTSQSTTDSKPNTIVRMAAEQPDSHIFRILLLATLTLRSTRVVSSSSTSSISVCRSTSSPICRPMSFCLRIMAAS